jgi:hypothetical protein
MPSLDDWEKEWGNNLQRSVQPKLLLMDFRSQPISAGNGNTGAELMTAAS